MDTVTEATLRSTCHPGCGSFAVPPGAFVTAPARKFAEEHGIRLEESGYASMPWTKPPAEAGQEKPEAMTHIRAGELVEKTDPRIAFRGKLDSFQAEVLCLMAAAHRARRAALVTDLNGMLALCRQILAAEVKQTPLPAWTLLGMEEAALHKASHTPPHPVPDYRMGETAMALNRLRTLSRELELAWLSAYPAQDRPDIVLALNRLSSALYLLFRKEVKQYG